MSRATDFLKSKGLLNEVKDIYHDFEMWFKQSKDHPDLVSDYNDYKEEMKKKSKPVKLFKDYAKMMWTDVIKS
jgi:hypothetical protein